MQSKRLGQSVPVEEAEQPTNLCLRLLTNYEVCTESKFRLYFLATKRSIQAGRNVKSRLPYSAVDLSICGFKFELTYGLTDWFWGVIRRNLYCDNLVLICNIQTFKSYVQNLCL